MTTPNVRTPILEGPEAHMTEQLAQFLASYDHYLASPAGAEDPNRSGIEEVRACIQEIASGHPVTPVHQLSLIVAARHFYGACDRPSSKLDTPTGPKVFDC